LKKTASLFKSIDLQKTAKAFAEMIDFKKNDPCFSKLIDLRKTALPSSSFLKIKNLTISIIDYWLIDRSIEDSERASSISYVSTFILGF